MSAEYEPSKGKRAMSVAKVMIVDEQILFWDPVVEALNSGLGCEVSVIPDVGSGGSKIDEVKPDVIIARKWFRDHSEVRMFMDWADRFPDMVGILVVSSPEPKSTLIPLLTDTRAFAVVPEDIPGSDYVELVRSALLEGGYRKSSRAVRTDWLTKTSAFMGIDKDEVLRGVSQSERPSIRDSLTQLYNPRLTRSHLEYEVNRHFRYRAVLSIVFFDIDNFKKINDTYGHQVGDLVLQSIGAVVAETVRGADIAGRYGGEEFLILCPQTTLQGGAVLAERMRVAVSELRVPVAGENLKVTISIGVAATNPNVFEKSADVLSRADQALYTSKKSGKNKVTSEIVLTAELQARLQQLDPMGE